MSRIGRTPYNAARWDTENISSDQVISERSSGKCLFVTAGQTTTLTIDFATTGCYLKIILTDTSTASLTIVTPAMEGILIFDDSGVDVLPVGNSNETKIILPSGAAAGSYLDLVCDGTKWYVSGMTHGVTWQQSA